MKIAIRVRQRVIQDRVQLEAGNVAIHCVPVGERSEDADIQATTTLTETLELNAWRHDWQAPEGQSLFDMQKVPAARRRELDELWTHLETTTRGLLAKARWRWGSAESLWDPPPTRFVVDDNKATWLALDGTQPVRLPCFFREPPQATRQALEALLGERDEPLAHTLLQEAKRMFDAESFRGALVVAMSAAEVGTKRYYSSRFPMLKDFLKEIPSPPLAKMLKEIANVKSDRPGATGTAIPEKLRSALRKHVEIRNDVTHSGDDVDRPRAHAVIGHVESLLYLLDVHSGHEWALDHVAPEFRGLP